MDAGKSYADYDSLYEESLSDPRGFWAKQAERLDWAVKPTDILDDSRPPFTRWFTDGRLSITHNCLTRHLPRLAAKPAFICEGNIAHESSSITYAELHEQVELLAHFLTSLGVASGDRAIVYMPMILQTPVAVLAVARLGAVHSVVFGGFSAKELSNRILDSQAKVVLAASCGLEPHKVVDYQQTVREALRLAGQEQLPVIYFERVQRPLDSLRETEHRYTDALARGRELAAAKPGDLAEQSMPSTDPLYILYTSGTTGTPKGIYRDIGGTAVSVMLSMELGFDFSADSVMFSTSDFGWVVGHSYMLYGPLLFGATSILYEGKPVGTPDCLAYFRVVEKHRATVLYTSPTAMRAVMKEDYEGERVRGCDLSSLRVVGVVGERTDLNTFKFLERVMPPDCLYNDTYWQTESGSFICANFARPQRFPSKPGSCTKPYPGYRLRVLDEAGQPVAPFALGHLYAELPTPPGFMTSLWRSDAFFVQKYFSQLDGFYSTGDVGFRDDDGYVHVMSRCDDVINVAGHRISVYQLEEVAMKHPAVAEAVFTGIKEELKGQIPFGVMVARDGTGLDTAAARKEIVALIRAEIGPIATPYAIAFAARLPKTRSGKVLRGTIKKIFDKEEYACPETIEDATVLQEYYAIAEKYLSNRRISEYETDSLSIRDDGVNLE